MKLKHLSLHPYQIPLINGQIRHGALIHLIDEFENEAFGDIAPLPNWSKENLDQSLNQIHQCRITLLEINWTLQSFSENLLKLQLYPSVVFGFTSALLEILDPLPAHTVSVSALLMGSVDEILEQATLRYNEGFTSAKLKVSQLSFQEASFVIQQLKSKFHLRIDVNRAWNTSDSLDFFSQFQENAFDYVEEPFRNPKDLFRFTHPLAVDESYFSELSLKELETLPTLKALIYKPTLQGGIIGCLSLLEWTKHNQISLVLSSSFESDIGLCCIASMACRLSLNQPIGIGTYHYMTRYLSSKPLQLSKGKINIYNKITSIK